MVMDLKYAESSCMAHIDFDLCRINRLCFTDLVHFRCLQQCLEGKPVLCLAMNDISRFDNQHIRQIFSVVIFYQKSNRKIKRNEIAKRSSQPRECPFISSKSNAFISLMMISCKYNMSLNNLFVEIGEKGNTVRIDLTNQ